MGDNTEIPTDSFLDRVLKLSHKHPAVADGSISAGGNTAGPSDVPCSECGRACGADWAFCETCGEVLTVGRAGPAVTTQIAMPGATAHGAIEDGLASGPGIDER